MQIKLDSKTQADNDRAKSFVWKFAKPEVIEGREDEGEIWTVRFHGYQHAEHDIKDLIISVAAQMGQES